MKKYICILAVVSASLTACDFNERNFEGLDELSRPTNVAAYEYTLTDADITAIVNALTATGVPADAAMAAQLAKDRMFSDLAPASVCIPHLLTAKYTTPDLNSSANITYNSVVTRSGELAALSTPSYTLTDEDYQLAWGSETDFSKALTPDVPPATAIPAILLAGFPEAVEGDYKIVDYNYAEGTPAAQYLTAGFEDNPAGTGSNVAVDLEGWINTDLSGALFWQCRYFAAAANAYAQISSFNSGSVNSVWLISPAIDLPADGSPLFTFDYNSGFYNADCLTVHVSEDFDGTADNIGAATWMDITDNFTFVQGTSSGYGTLTNVGNMDFSAYAGKKVYIGFNYKGDGTTGNPATTTVQIDNIRVSEPSEMEAPVRVYAAWRFNGTAWSAAPNSVVVLQPGDYAAMGVNYLGTDIAPDYLPTYLGLKYPYAKEGTAFTVVFKSDNAGGNYADIYTRTGGAWVPSVTETVTSQFVYSVDGWVFDPTVTYTMVKTDYQSMVQYVIDNFAAETPALVSSYGDSEYYYGFSAYHSNISLREVDRGKDPAYAALTTDEEKKAYFRDRTSEGLEIFMRYKYPEATPQVSGIDVYANITCAMYDGVATDRGCTFRLRCTGSNPSTWEYVEQTAGTVYW